MLVINMEFYFQIIGAVLSYLYILVQFDGNWRVTNNSTILDNIPNDERESILDYSTNFNKTY